MLFDKIMGIGTREAMSVSDHYPVSVRLNNCKHPDPDPWPVRRTMSLDS